MVGRDPNEPHRTATPLELLFDLTFVVAFSQAGAQAAHLLELGHWGPAILGFLFAVFAICLGVDQLLVARVGLRQRRHFFRVATMVQMLGVLVLALGLPDAVPLDRRGRAPRQRRGGRRVRHHARRDDRALAADRPSRRRAPPDGARPTRSSSAIIQVGWVATIFINPPLNVMLGIIVVLGALELSART